MCALYRIDLLNVPLCITVESCLSPAIVIRIFITIFEFHCWYFTYEKQESLANAQNVCATAVCKLLTRSSAIAKRTAQTWFKIIKKS